MSKLTGHQSNQHLAQVKMGKDYQYYNGSPENRVKAKGLSLERRLGTCLVLTFQRLQKESA